MRVFDFDKGDWEEVPGPDDSDEWTAADEQAFQEHAEMENAQ